jgi:hypothetical protein
MRAAATVGDARRVTAAPRALLLSTTGNEVGVFLAQNTHQIPVAGDWVFIRHSRLFG